MASPPATHRTRPTDGPGHFSGLVTTKLHPPRAKLGALERAALVGRLRTTAARLILIEAPAGWGKSTLLADWYHSVPHPEQFASYAVEHADNDASVFWAYLLEAVGRIEPLAVDEAAALHAAVGTSPIRDVIPSLINGLQLRSREMTILLEDYHVIDNPAIHEAMSYLVEHLPPGHTVVVTTRRQPPFPVARLRARGQLLELGLDDLRFDLEESHHLLEAEIGRTVTLAHAATLQDRTEGWPAGLHLAALSLRGCADLEGRLEQIAGDDRHIVDYLVSEVLDRLPEELRTFLRRSAVLERFCNSLCDAMLERSDSQHFLDQIEQAQLFIIPLDNRRRWYRYHHLFEELLRRELDVVEGPGAATELRRRAAGWFEGQSLTVEATAHALYGRDYPNASRLLVTHYLEHLNEGQIDRLLGWFDLMPPACFETAELAFARAVCLHNAGRVDEVERWLRAAEMADDVSGPITGQFPSLEAGIASIRSHVCYSKGDLGEAERWSRIALAVTAVVRDDTFVNSFVLGAASYHRGDHDQALRWFERDRLWALATGIHVLVLLANGFVAAIALAEGDLIGAQRQIRESRSLSQAHHLSQHWSNARVELVHANLLASQGRPLEALPVLRDALDLAARGGDRLLQLELLRSLATLEREASDPLATRHEAEARRLAAACPDPGPLASWIAPPGTLLLPAGLTSRQAGVLRLVAQGLSDAEVAHQLALSERTVHAHLRNIYAKLGVKGRTAATRFAVEQHLV